MPRHYASASTQWSRAAKTPPAFPFTFACWAFIDANGLSTLMAFGNTGSGNEYHTLNYNSTSGNTAANSQTSVTARSSTIAGLSQNRWSAIAGIWAAANSRQVWLNGVFGTAETTSISPSGLNEYSLGNQVTYSNYLNGHLAWPTVWDCALSACELWAFLSSKDPRQIRPQNIWAQTELSRDEVNRASTALNYSARSSAFTMPGAATQPDGSARLPPPIITIQRRPLLHFVPEQAGSTPGVGGGGAVFRSQVFHSPIIGGAQ